MKRVGHLFEAVLEPENLRLAFWKASRGKHASPEQQAYAAHLEEELQALREGLAQGNYPVGAFRRFVIHDPKTREICAAPFRERVLHHALTNVLEPWVERWLIPDTYACLKGRGQLRAVLRAQAFAHKNRWFLKGDFRRFFDSVPHEGIRAMLRRKLKDTRMVAWLERIVATYETMPGRGLPIGNLTSQHLANLYLDPLDRLCQGHYVRYMDDFVLWSDDREALLRRRDEIEAFARERLGLALKGRPFLNRTMLGMDFLGMRLFPQGLRLARGSQSRFRRKARHYAWLLASGAWDEATYQARITALTAFTEVAGESAASWRRRFFSHLEGVAKATDGNRVIRGGNWKSSAADVRSASRSNNSRDNRNNNIGFRAVCRPAPQQPPKAICSPRHPLAPSRDECQLRAATPVARPNASDTLSWRQ